MSILNNLTEDMKRSMKSGDKARLSVVRMLISAIKYAQIDSSNELTNDDELMVLNREAKKRREAIEMYKGKSEERAVIEAEELKVIEEYLPSQTSDEEVSNLIAKVKADYPNLEIGPLMGRIMGEIKKVGMVVDGSRVRELISKS